MQWGRAPRAPRDSGPAPLVHRAPVAEHFSFTTQADWLLCDPNGHKRNSAYLGLAVRMRYLDANGFPVSEFARLGLGPVVR